MEEHKGTPIEKKKWYKTIKAIIGMVTALICSIVAIIQITRPTIIKVQNVQAPVSKVRKVQENTEIVLDRSADMSESFDGKTKWDAAVSAIDACLEYQVAQNDNLALRIFGGSCSENDNTELLVDFQQHNKDKVRNALKKIKLVGQPTLASALLEATGDFNDLDRFGSVNKKVIIIAGSYDSCHSNLALHSLDLVLLERLRDRKDAKENIKVDIHIIGMGIPIFQREQFKEIANATGGTMYFPDSKEDLEYVLKNIGSVAYGAKITLPSDTSPPSPPVGLQFK